MSSTNKTTAPSTLSEQDAMESGVRRALGMPSLGGTQPPRQQAPRQADHAGAGHQKRRFVQDGEVPVVMLRGRLEGKPRAPEFGAAPTMQAPGQSTEALETQLRIERDAKAAALRALDEANAALKDLRTRIFHAELAAEEARAQARQAIADRAVAEAALAVETEARAKAEARAARSPSPIEASASGDAVTARRPGRPRIIRPVLPEPAEQPRQAAAPRPAVSRQSGTRGRDAAEPKPVKWWIKKKPAR